MKRVTAFLLLWALFAWAAPAAMAHGQFRVVLEPSEEGLTYGPGYFGFDFYLIDTELEKLVFPTDVGSDEIVLHIYDAALGKLSSAGAVYDPVAHTWHTELELPYSMEYWIWAEGAFANEQDEPFLGGGSIVVEGVEHPPVDPLSEVSIGSEEGSIVSLIADDIVAEQESELKFKFSRKDGSAPSISCDSLATDACADIFVATEDGDGLYHLVALRSATGEFVAKFNPPGEGKYRAWVLFSDDQEPRQIPLAFTAAQ